MKQKRLICGIGINDSGTAVTKEISGRTAKDPFYSAWKDMIRRCYEKKLHVLHPTYSGCSVVDDWHVFSSFRVWMESKDWAGKQLDKDLLIAGNKVYSPETCVFISRQLNTFLSDSGAARGDWPLGVHFSGSRMKFEAQCRNPFTGKKEYLGQFDSPEEAHKAWRNRKREHAKTYASQQADSRISEALLIRYAD